jgi:hypothetical protein
MKVCRDCCDNNGQHLAEVAAEADDEDLPRKPRLPKQTSGCRYLRPAAKAATAESKYRP